MSTKDHEKGEMWVKYVTLIRNYGEKKTSSKEKSDLIDYLATSMDGLDNFFYWLPERQDVYETNEFPMVMMSILERTMFYRNVPLFQRFVYDFGPVYLSSFSPEVLSHKHIGELLNRLFCSYPLKRDFLFNSLQDPVNDFLNTIIGMKASSTQKSYLDFIQNLCFLYPELKIKSELLPDSLRCSPYSDNVVGKRVQSYYLTGWKNSIMKDAPPIGNYLSDNEGVLGLNAKYDVVSGAYSWFSVSTPIHSITKFIHLTSEEGFVYVVHVQQDRVMFWVCPHCSVQNHRVGPCSACHAPLPESVRKNGFSSVYYLSPGCYFNNHYITQNEDVNFPSACICYSQPSGNQHLLQHYLSSALDSLFKLPSLFYISCQFPQDFNYYNSLFSSIVLPECNEGCFMILYSDILSVSYNATHSSLILSANPNVVANFKGISYRDCCKTNKNVMTLETPVDKDLICNIHYAVLNPLKVVIQVYNNIIICKLKEPIPNITAHLSRFTICNVPGENGPKDKIGVLGMIIYHYTAESKWTEIPPNAIVFSLIGSHFCRERGLRYLSETRSCRCFLSIGCNDPKKKLPWYRFIEKDNRLYGNRNAFLVNEFCCYNSVCMMNPNVDCKNAHNLMKFGYGPRIGNLYWKFAFNLSSLDISFCIDMELKDDSFGVWWLTNETIPSHYFVNMLCKSIMSFLAQNTLAEEFIPIPFYLEHSMAFVILKKLNSTTMKVHYAYTVSDTTYNHLLVKPGKELPIRDHFYLDVCIGKGSLLLKQDGHYVDCGYPMELPTDFYQVESYFLSGLSGSFMTLFDYSLNSNPSRTPTETFGTPLIISDRLTHLTALQELSETTPVSSFPCSLSYRDKPAYGSTDPALSNPKRYEGKGHIFALNPSYHNYAVIASNENEMDFFFCIFDNDDTRNTVFSIYSNETVMEKRLSRTPECDVSCFANNRIQRFGKNFSGIANSNNTCFQNSTLQLLFHSDSLKKSIFEFYEQFAKSSCDQTTPDALCMKELVMLLIRLQISIRGYELNHLVEVLQKRFEVGFQHDMNEYFDYLLNSVDNSYLQMKKQVGEKAMEGILNPMNLLKGKQEETICCQCGKSSHPCEKKEVEFQNSYISLTSPIAPITSISFELFAYDTFPVRPFTTFIFVFEYKSKGVYLALERNPTKTPISNLLLREDKRKLPADSVRVPSFHSYVSSQLYYRPFLPSYHHESVVDEENTTVNITTNQLIVDVLIRVVTSTTPDVSQTNNGVFEYIGSFQYEDQEYEMYQKVIGYSSHGVLDMKASMQWKPQFDVSAMIPTKLDSVNSHLASVISPSNCTEERKYVLFSQQIELGNCSKEKTLSVYDKDHVTKMALYSNRSLAGIVSIDPRESMEPKESMESMEPMEPMEPIEPKEPKEPNVIPCRVCRCELFVGETLISHGQAYYSNNRLCIFDETYFDETEYKIVVENQMITVFEYEGEWYEFQGCQETESDKYGVVLESFFMKEDKSIKISLAAIVENGQAMTVKYTPKFTNKESTFSGVLLSYETQFYLYIPHSSDFAGCYYTFAEEDPYLPIERIGSSFWYQKKRLVVNDAVCYIFAGYSISYFVYTPQVYELSVASMVLPSQDSFELCESCHTPVCKRNVITQFPEYFPISISRTFFDTTNYSLTKDCSHIAINPTMNMQGEVYDLYSIVVHVGYSFDSGHYVVYCRHSDDGGNVTAENPLNQWNLFNDDTVYPCEWSEVLSQISDYGTCPYFVVYRRRCHLSKSKPSCFLPSYTELASFQDFSIIYPDFVKLVEESNNYLLSEIPYASFLLRNVHSQFEK